MSPDDWPLLRSLHRALLPALEKADDRLFVAGICGAQGSGKSTLAAALADKCRSRGIETGILSLDDLYLTRSERQRLAREVHPLFRTRGVPGTHDVPLGLAVVEALEKGGGAPLPRFDKAVDERVPRSQWPIAPSGTRLLILEGWCVGARPQPEAELAAPVNALEREEDSDGSWRRYANAALGGKYQSLFDRIDFLTLLAAPSWEIVHDWRVQQEQALRADHPGQGMADREIDRFIQHYERLTRYILEEMPGRADFVAALDQDRSLRSVRTKAASD